MDMNKRGGELLCASSSNFESVDGQACDWSFVCLIESDLELVALKETRSHPNGLIWR